MQVLHHPPPFSLLSPLDCGHPVSFRENTGRKLPPFVLCPATVVMVVLKLQQHSPGPNYPPTPHWQTLWGFLVILLLNSFWYSVTLFCTFLLEMFFFLLLLKHLSVLFSSCLEKEHKMCHYEETFWLLFLCHSVCVHVCVCLFLLFSRCSPWMISFILTSFTSVISCELMTPQPAPPAIIYIVNSRSTDLNDHWTTWMCSDTSNWACPKLNSPLFPSQLHLIQAHFSHYSCLH